jgi:uncharacterized membrane protein YbaN (DUF454 family)
MNNIIFQSNISNIESNRINYLGDIGMTGDTAGLEGMTGDNAGLEGMTGDTAGLEGMTGDTAGLEGMTGDTGITGDSYVISSYRIINTDKLYFKRLRTDSDISEQNNILLEEQMNNIYKKYKENNNILYDLKKSELEQIIKYIKNKSYYFKLYIKYKNNYYIKNNDINISNNNKCNLIDCIKLYYKLNKNAEIIQKYFKKSLKYKLIKLRGPALMNRNICVNDTDFCTLEPLIDIENKYFFSYEDIENNNSYIYGFDVSSLWKMYKKKGIILTNNSLKKLSIVDKKANKKIFTEMNEIIKSNNKILNKIRHPYNGGLINNESKIYKNAIELYLIINLLKETDISKNEIKQENSILYINQNHISNTISASSYLEEENFNNYFNEQNLKSYLEAKIYEIRNKTLNVRINEIFIELNFLDFYTDSNWFFNLSKHKYFLFIEKIKEIWFNGFMNNFNYYDKIPNETKTRICFLHDLFYGINIYFVENEKTIDEIKEYAVYIIENLIHLGINIEYKKLGALYVLTALTFVSRDARITLNWLNENYNI